MATNPHPTPPMIGTTPHFPPPPSGVTSSAPDEFPAGKPSAYFDREPVITAATIVGILSAIVSWAVSKNYLGEAEQTMLLAIIPAVSAVAFAYYARRGVTSVGRANAAIDAAYTAQPGLDPKPKL